MKKTALILSTFGLMAIFGFGFSVQQMGLGESDVEQVHLTCWDEQGQSSFERIRLVLNKGLTGLVWFSKFNGDPVDEGTIAPDQQASSATTFSVNVLSATQSFIAQVPQFVFQPHIKSLRLMVEKDDVHTSLECRKINLQKRQSSL